MHNVYLLSPPSLCAAGILWHHCILEPCKGQCFANTFPISTIILGHTCGPQPIHPQFLLSWGDPTSGSVSALSQSLDVFLRGHLSVGRVVFKRFLRLWGEMRKPTILPPFLLAAPCDDNVTWQEVLLLWPHGRSRMPWMCLAAAAPHCAK